METIQDLENRLSNTQDPIVQKTIRAKIQKLQLTQSASGGDEVAQMMLLLKDAIDKYKGSGGGGSMSPQEVDNFIRQYFQSNKITLSDLDDSLQSYLTASVKVNLILRNTSLQQVTGGKVKASTYNMPLFQKILSDAISMNNIYLFGGAGTGKTFIAKELADFLGYEFITLNCNQYTSPLEIIGGQTIDGYQRGKLERAWGNLDLEGKPSKYNGAVLCIDEMPKIDPNTAGLFNDALAKVKDYKEDPNDPLNRDADIPPTIENGRGEPIQKKNLVVIATGNLKLNEVSTEYEANFKQDLSLQDRFVGSTYEVTVDYQSEWDDTMKGFAFIYIPLLKLRQKIEAEKWTSFAFVSRRIMISLKATYITYRSAKDNTLGVPSSVGDALINPKTLKQGVDSFLNLFKPDQIKKLQIAMDYDDFIKTIEIKNTMPIDALDTQQEINTVLDYIKINKELNAQKIA